MVPVAAASIAVPSGVATAAPVAAPVAAPAPQPVAWPQYMFNIGHTGFNNLETPVTRQNVTNLSFEFGALGPSGDTDIGNSFVHSSPAVSGGVMYLGTTGGQFLAFSATGCGDDFCQPLWSAQLSNGVFVSPAVVNGVVYVESAGTEDGRLYAFKAAGCGAAECKPLWSAVNHGNVGSSPTIANGLVYTASSDGHLYTYNALGCGAAECKPVWSGAIGTTSSEGSPAVAGATTGTNSVVYVAGDKQLFAFRAGGCGQATCTPVWSSKPLGGVEAFQGSGPSVSSPSVSSPSVPGTTVFIASSDTSVSVGRLYAFDASGCGQSVCAPLWFGQVEQNNFEVTPAVAGGFVYAGATDGLFAFNASGCGRPICAPVWRGSPAGGVFAGTGAAPAVAGGVVYSAQNNNRIAAYDARGCGDTTCEPLWSFVTQDPIVNTPVIVNGRLYVSGSNFGFTPEVYVFHPAA
jgi:hypothetical protein